jgi:hypothetical protein
LERENEYKKNFIGGLKLRYNSKIRCKIALSKFSATIQNGNLKK